MPRKNKAPKGATPLGVARISFLLCVGQAGIAEDIRRYRAGYGEMPPQYGSRGPSYKGRCAVAKLIAGGRPVTFVGHPSPGVGRYTFTVDSVERVREVRAVLAARYERGDDEIHTGVAHVTARDFRLQSWGVPKDSGHFSEVEPSLGTWDDWLEQQVALKHPLVVRAAIAYFGLVIDSDAVEEDARSGEELAKTLMADESAMAWVDLESRALKALAKALQRDIYTEAHDSRGELVCKIPISDYAEIAALYSLWEAQHHPSDNDEIDTAEPYTSARDLRFYPNGVNDAFFGEEAGATKSLETWLAAHRPQWWGR